VDRHSPHLPQAAPIDAYGKGGFRFAGMSHRGSLLCLPDGIWPCPAASPQHITEASFALVFAATYYATTLALWAGHWFSHLRGARSGPFTSPGITRSIRTPAPHGPRTSTTVRAVPRASPRCSPGS